ncbi:MAG: twin-arginine translocase TatA/TatE family subunit [Chloroflexi bacterium]|nr:twin-arginine translocase TatA/TatE family subunit [Chloroflexota bacterium]
MFEGLLQPTHLALILVLVLVIFGPGKLPQLGKALGESVRELRNTASDITQQEPATKAE